MNDKEKEFWIDKEEGMPLVASLEIYKELGEEFIRKAYKANIKEGESPLITEVKKLGEKIEKLPKEFPEFQELPKIPEQKEFPKEFDIRKPIWWKEMKTSEFPKEIKVSNFPKGKDFPKEFGLKKPFWFPDFQGMLKTAGAFLKKTILKVKIEEQKAPLRVNIFDGEGNLVGDFTPKIYPSRGGGGGPNKTDMSAAFSSALNGYATEDKQDDAISELQKITGFEIPPNDYISLSYTGDNLTGVVFKEGGSGGSTVATLTLGYTGDNLTSVTKT